MMDRNLSVFPVNPELMPLIRYTRQCGYNIGCLIAPKSFGYHGRDVGFIDGGPALGKVVTDYVSDGLHEGDAVYMDFYPKIRKNKYFDIVKMFSQYGVKILASRLLEAVLSDLNEPIKYVGGNFVEHSHNTYLHMINVPTVLVLGAGEQTDKFDIQLNLRNYYITKGYKVLQYGSKDYSSLFGFLPLPNFLYEPIGFERKIMSLNSYLHTQVTNQSPDILILGVPGGIERASIKEPRYFGELAHVISKSVNPDVCIMSLYNSNYSEEHLLELRNKLRHCFNTQSTYFHVTNKKFLFDFEGKETGLEFLTKNSIDCTCETGWFNIHNHRMEEEFDKLFIELSCAKHVMR